MEKQDKGRRRVYLAAPFFTEEEVANIERAEAALAGRGLDVFSPMRHGAQALPGTTQWAYELFETDRSAIDGSDLVVALYYGSNGDTGTAWECGYAAAKGIPVVLVHMNRDGDSNLMMHCGCTTNIGFADLASFDFDALPVYEYEGKMF